MKCTKWNKAKRIKRKIGKIRGTNNSRLKAMINKKKTRLKEKQLQAKATRLKKVNKRRYRKTNQKHHHLMSFIVKNAECLPSTALLLKKTWLSASSSCKNRTQSYTASCTVRTELNSSRQRSRPRRRLPKMLLHKKEIKFQLQTTKTRRKNRLKKE